MKKIMFLLAGLFFVMAAAAEDSSSPASESESSTASSELERKTAENLNEAREALRFGVDATVLGVIKQARDGKDKRMIDDIAPLLGSPNDDVSIAVLDYLSAIEEYGHGMAKSRELVDRYQDLSDKLLVRILTFFRAAKTVPDETLRKTIREIASLTSKDRQLQAIQTIGALEFQDALSFLRDLYTKTEIGLEQQKAVLQALGNKKSLDQLDFLREIIEDEGSDKELRRAALVAVGQLADDSVLPIIRKAMVSNDLFERTAAIGALEGFDIGKVEDLYRQALRDSAWRHRVSAIKQISDRKALTFSDALVYMAQKDNERPVRQAAIQALIAGDNSWNVFIKWMEDKKIGSDFKALLSSELTRKHAEKVLPGLRSIIDAEWSVTGSKLLEAVAKDLAAAQANVGELYEKLLAHSNDTIRIYGVRGILNNKMSLYKSRLEEIARGNIGASLKASIDDAVKKL